MLQLEHHILKKRVPEIEFQNNETVSDLNYASELVKNAVAKQYKEHLIRNNPVNKYQSACNSGHSREMALFTSTSLLFTVNMLLRFYDTIDHNLLLNHLEKCFGFAGNAFQWLFSNIIGCEQSVKINDIFSDSKDLDYGYTQGSALRLLLFSVYITQVSKILLTYKDVKQYLHAGDTQVYIKNTIMNFKVA